MASLFDFITGLTKKKEPEPRFGQKKPDQAALNAPARLAPKEGVKADPAGTPEERVEHAKAAVRAGNQQTGLTSSERLLAKPTDTPEVARAKEAVRAGLPEVGQTVKFDDPAKEREYVNSLPIEEAKRHFMLERDQQGGKKLSYEEAKERGAVDVYLKSLNPFDRGVKGAIEDFTPLGGLYTQSKVYKKTLDTYMQNVKANPAMGNVAVGDGVLQGWWKDQLQRAGEFGLDLGELIIGDKFDYRMMKTLTNAARTKMGLPQEPVFASRAEETKAFLSETGQQLKQMAGAFIDAGLATFEVAAIRDPVKKKEAMAQYTQSVFDAATSAATFGIEGERKRRMGFTSNEQGIFYKGQKIGELTPEQRAAARSGQVAGSVGGSMVLWSAISPYIGKKVVDIIPALKPVAVAHPWVFQVTFANAAEEFTQAVISGVAGVPYTFADAVFGMAMQLGFETFSLAKATTGGARYDPLGLRGDAALKDIDFKAALEDADKAIQDFATANRRTPTPMELQDLLGERTIPGSRQTWNDVYQTMAQKFGKGYAENRLIGLKDAEAGRVETGKVEGVRGSTDAELQATAKRFGTSPENLEAIVRGAGTDLDNIEAALRQNFGTAYDDAIKAATEAVEKGDAPMGALDIADPLRKAVFGDHTTGVLPTKANQARIDTIVSEAKAHGGEFKKIQKFGEEAVAAYRDFDIPKTSLEEIAKTNRIGDLLLDPDSVKMALEDVQAGRVMDSLGKPIEGKITEPINVFYDMEKGEYTLQNGYHRLLETINRGESSIRSETVFGKKRGDSFYVDTNQEFAAPKKGLPPVEVLSDIAPRKIETGKPDVRAEERVREEEPRRLTDAEQRAFETLSTRDLETLRSLTSRENITATTQVQTRQFRRLAEQGFLQEGDGGRFTVTDAGREFSDLSTRDVPPELAPSKADTVSQLYGQSLIKSTFDGRPVTTNAYILEFGDIPKEPYLGKLRDTTMEESTIRRIIDPAIKADVPVEPFAFRSVGGQSGGVGNAMFLRGQGGEMAKVNLGYLNYFRNKYGKDIEFFVQKDNPAMNPVTVKRPNGDMVGLIMQLSQGAGRENPPAPMRLAVPKTQPRRMKTGTPEKIARDVVKKAKEEGVIDYKGLHKAPGRGDGTNAPGHDVSGGKDGIYPSDIYTAQNAHRLYGHGGDSKGIEMDKESVALIRSIRGKPDAEITIYRAVPKDAKNASINKGDWVTLNRNYAVQHGESNLNGEYKIISKKVRADEIFTDGNSIHEFGYDPSPPREPPKPPKAPAPKEEPDAPKPKQSRFKISQKPPRPLEEVQPQRDSRLRRRLGESRDTKPEQDSRASIKEFIERELTAPLRTGSVPSHAGAVFKPGTNTVRLRENRFLNLGDVSHEVGHYLDQEIGLLASLQQSGTTKTGKGFVNYSEPYRSELKALAEDPAGYSSAKGAGASLFRKMQEGIAEFIRLYVVDAGQVAQRAPGFYAYFEKAVPTEAIRVLKEARAALNRIEGSTPEARVKSHISYNTKEPQRGIVDRAFEALDDDLLQLRKFVKTTEGLTKAELLYKDDPYILARMTRGLDAKTQTWIMPNHKPVGHDLRPLDIRSLGDILRDVGKGNEADWDAYIASKRAIDLHRRGITTGFRKGDVREVVSIMEKRHPKFPELQKEMVKWNNSLLKYALDGGFISQSHFDAMQQYGMNYVPFYRAVEEMHATGGKKRFGSSSSPIKRIKGSERPIVSPTDSMIKNAYTVLSAVDRNDVGQALVRAARKHPDLGEFVEQIKDPVKPVTVGLKQALEAVAEEMGMPRSEIPENLEGAITLFVKGGKAGSAGENVLTVMHGGKPSYYHLEPNLYRAVTAMDRESVGMMLRILSTPTSVLRAGATLTPEFIGRNPFRDQVTAFLYSRGGYIPFVDMVRGFNDYFKRGEGYQRAAAGGALNSGFVSVDRASLRKQAKEIIKTHGDRFKDYFTLADVRESYKDARKEGAGRLMASGKGFLAFSPLEPLRILSEIGEYGTRVGEAKRVFQREFKKTGDYKEAVLRSSFSARNVTLDFKRMGTAGRTWNMVAAFFNAAKEDMTKLGREFAGTEKGSDPKRALIKAAIGLTVPSIMFHELSKNDERYKDLPRWRRDYFWNIAIPGVPIISLPKPFLPGLIFGSFPVRLIEAAEEKSMKPLHDYFESFREQGIPNIMPTALMPILEWQAEYSFFMGRNTIPMSESTLLPEDQYGIFTPEIYKRIGKITGQSPRKIETFIYGYGAGLSRYAAQFIDIVGAKTGALPEKPQLPADISNVPFLRAFVLSDVRGQSQAVQDFYDRYGRAYAAYRSIGQAKTADRLREIARDHLGDAMYVTDEGKPEFIYHALLGVSKQFSDLRKAQDVVMESKLSPKRKAEILKESNELMRELAQAALRQTERTFDSVDDLIKALK
jgi:hypothetical protein